MIPAPPTATLLADFDFETYSEAGFVRLDGGKLSPLPGAQKKGLLGIGMAAYAEHPTTEVLSLAYNLKDGCGPRQWVPGQPPPEDLFAHIRAGGLLEAFNSSFEWLIWHHVCFRRFGWPRLPLEQLRDARAKARAWTLPPYLDGVAQVLGTSAQKMADGKRLLNKFSVPQAPTKAQPLWRIRPEDDPADAARLYEYNVQDIEAEAEVSSRIPGLHPDELQFWLIDQKINRRGVQMDTASIEACIALVEAAFERHNVELEHVTGGTVTSATQIQKLSGWLGAHGVYPPTLGEDDVKAALERDDLPPHCRRALEIRSLVGSASVRKLYAMRVRTTRTGRLHDLFDYHAARTGRAAGSDVQAQNLPSSGPDMALCGCGGYYHPDRPHCSYCTAPRPVATVPEWGPDAAAAVLYNARQVHALFEAGPEALDTFEQVFGPAVPAIVGCLRALFVATDCHDLIGSDFSAIEAVVAAALAGEQWRLDVFQDHGLIYETSAAKIAGLSLDDFIQHKKETGQHHPLRKKIGKIAELASGYQGWVGAWKAFGADAYFTDDEIKDHILAWRAASPAIVEMWGGQYRGPPWDRTPELFGLEGAAIAAIMQPGERFTYRHISYQVRGDVLYCRLPSTREIAYHHPRLIPGDRAPWTITFWGYNTNPNNGPRGWIEMRTWGGKLFENVVQAVSRDILRDAIMRLEAAGYPVVLHVHDEIVAEVIEGFGSVEEFESIMSERHGYYSDWPIRVSGGWRGKRFRK